MGLFTFTYEVLNEKLNFFAVSHTRAQMENDQGSTIRVRRVHAYTGAIDTYALILPCALGHLYVFFFLSRL